MSYPSYPKIERFKNIYCVISEKVDGTNGLISIYEDTEADNKTTIEVRFGSRNKWIDVHNDNAGFCNFFTPHIEKIKMIPKVLQDNAENELDDRNEASRFPIRIYGEWYGQSIQRNYGLKEKLFMPFSTILAEAMISVGIPNIKVPEVIYKGKFSTLELSHAMGLLSTDGSLVVPGWFNPEGVVIYFPKYNFCLKDTFEGE